MYEYMDQWQFPMVTESDQPMMDSKSSSTTTTASASSAQHSLRIRHESDKPLHEGPITGLDIQPTHSDIATAGEDGTLCLLNPSTLKPIRVISKFCV
jgi:WD40 repeat protein